MYTYVPCGCNIWDCGIVEVCFAILEFRNVSADISGIKRKKREETAGKSEEFDTMLR